MEKTLISGTLPDRPQKRQARAKDALETLFVSCYAQAQAMAEKHRKTNHAPALANVIDCLKSLRPFVNSAKNAEEFRDLGEALENIAEKLDDIELNFAKSDKNKVEVFRKWFLDNQGRYPPGIDAQGNGFRAGKLRAEAHIEPQKLCELFLENSSDSFVAYLVSNPAAGRPDAIRPSEAIWIYQKCLELFERV